MTGSTICRHARTLGRSNVRTLGRPDVRVSGCLDVRTPAPLFFQFLRSSRRGPEPGRAVEPAAPRRRGAGPCRDERKNCEERTKNERKIRFWLAIFSDPALVDQIQALRTLRVAKQRATLPGHLLLLHP